MSELVCPKSGLECENYALCTVVNEPLVSVIPEIRQKVGGVAWNSATDTLLHELGVQADLLTIDFAAEADKDGSVTVCPQEIIEGPFGKKYGSDFAEQAAKGIVMKAVEITISRLQGDGR